MKNNVFVAEKGQCYLMLKLVLLKKSSPRHILYPYGQITNAKERVEYTTHELKDSIGNDAFLFSKSIMMFIKI